MINYTALKRCVFFTIPIILGWWAMEIDLGLRKTSYHEKFEDMLRRQTSLNTLILGSSQLLFGVNPSQLEGRSENLADTSQSLVIDAQLLRKYIDSLPHLKLVISGVSYFSLRSLLSDSTESWRNSFYIRTYDIEGDGSAWDRYRLSAWSNYFMFGPAQSANVIRAQLMGSPFFSKLQEGWIPYQPETLHLTRELGVSRIAQHHQIMSDDHLSTNLQALRSLCELATSHHAKIAFVIPPVSWAYRAVVRPDLLEELKSSVRAISKNCGAVFISYWDDPRFDAGDFHDTDHLHYMGAQKWSAILNDEIVKPALANKMSP